MPDDSTRPDENGGEEPSAEPPSHGRYLRHPEKELEMLTAQYASPGYKLVCCCLDCQGGERLDPYTGKQTGYCPPEPFRTTSDPGADQYPSDYVYPDRFALRYCVRVPFSDPQEYGSLLLAVRLRALEMERCTCPFCPRDEIPTIDLRKRHFTHRTDMKLMLCPLCRYPCMGRYVIREHLYTIHKPDLLRARVVGKSGATLGGVRGCDYLFSPEQHLSLAQAEEIFRPQKKEALADQYRVYVEDAIRDSELDSLAQGGEKVSDSTPSEGLSSFWEGRFRRSTCNASSSESADQEESGEVTFSSDDSRPPEKSQGPREPEGPQGSEEPQSRSKDSIRLRLRAFNPFDEDDIDLQKTILLSSGCLPHRGVEHIMVSKYMIGVMTMIGRHQELLRDEQGEILAYEDAHKFVPLPPQIAYLFWKEDPLCHASLPNNSAYLSHLHVYHPKFFSWIVSCPAIARIQTVASILAQDQRRSAAREAKRLKRERAAMLKPFLKKTQLPSKSKPKTPFSCDICGKILSSKACLKTHKASHARRAAKSEMEAITRAALGLEG